MTHYHYACSSDYLYIGWGDGEKVNTGIRLLSTMITISILSSWCCKDNISRGWGNNIIRNLLTLSAMINTLTTAAAVVHDIQRRDARDTNIMLLLFFAHWLSGFMHLLASTVQGEMMRFCWIRSNLIAIIKSIKVIELASSNMLAVTNLAICINLALIIYSHRNVTRVRSLASIKILMVFLALSVLVAVSAVPFWDEIILSGAQVWVNGSTPGRRAWVVFNHILLELISGFVMMITVLFLTVYRRPELRQVWKLHRRIQYYFGLTLIAIVTDLAIGIGGTLMLFNQYTDILMLLAFTSRNVHIALDTMVLYCGLGTTRFNIEGSPTVSSEAAVNHADDMSMDDASGTHLRTHSSSGRRSSVSVTPALDCTVSP